MTGPWNRQLGAARHAPRARRRRARAGSLLVVTLWLVTILSVLAVAVARYLAVEIRLTKYIQARAQAKALARSGVYLAMQRLAQDMQDGEEAYDWLQDDWAVFPDGDPEDPTAWLVRLSSAKPDEESTPPAIVIRVTDEERKLPLNRVRDSLTDPWFMALSALLQSPVRAQRIVDYLDDNNEPFAPNGLEADDASNPPYLAKNGPVVAPEELLEIPDVPEAFRTLADFTSLATLHGKLNINTVSPEVLEALGMGSSAAQALAACRAHNVIFESEATILTTAESCVGATGLSDTERTLLVNDFGVSSQTFTVISEGRVQQPPVTARVEALIDRSTDAGGQIRILGWRES